MKKFYHWNTYCRDATCTFRYIMIAINIEKYKIYMYYISKPSIIQK